MNDYVPVSASNPNWRWYCTIDKNIFFGVGLGKLCINTVSLELPLLACLNEVKGKQFLYVTCEPRHVY
jgi:hypothetical protein